MSQIVELNHESAALRRKKKKKTRNFLSATAGFNQTDHIYLARLLANEITLCKYPEKATWSAVRSSKKNKKLIIAANNQLLYMNSYQQLACLAHANC